MDRLPHWATLAGTSERFDPLLRSGTQPRGRCGARAPAVIIVGPPWPRSAAVRVIQSQIRYYRERGFFTVFVGVPFRWYLRHVPKMPEDLPRGVTELDADRVFVATFDENTYNSHRYQALNWRAFSGTVLDWQVVIAQACRLRDEETDFLRRHQAALFHVNHLYTLGFALHLRKRLFSAASRPPIILETHDFQSQLTRRKGDLNPRTGRHDSLKRLIQSETALQKRANVLIHLSLRDLGSFQKLLPGKPQFVVFPSIDENFKSRVRAAPAPSEAIDLLFVGQWHPANFGGIRWFLKKIWPLIGDCEYTLKIVGDVGRMVEWKSPKLYDTFRSCFVGEVADLVPYYRAARCVIAPMRWGTGISIKAVEALALGKPFVGTSAAFRGLPMDRLNKAGIRAYDDAEGFAEAISRTLGAERKAISISRAAYKDVFSIRASFSARDMALRAAGIRSGVGGRTSWRQQSAANSSGKMQPPEMGSPQTTAGVAIGRSPVTQPTRKQAAGNVRITRRKA